MFQGLRGKQEAKWGKEESRLHHDRFYVPSLHFSKTAKKSNRDRRPVKHR